MRSGAGRIGVDEDERFAFFGGLGFGFVKLFEFEDAAGDLEIGPGDGGEEGEEEKGKLHEGTKMDASGARVKFANRGPGGSSKRGRFGLVRRRGAAIFPA